MGEHSFVILIKRIEFQHICEVKQMFKAFLSTDLEKSSVDD